MTTTTPPELEPFIEQARQQTYRGRPAKVGGKKEQERAEWLALQVIIEKCKQSARYFIERYVHIEDRDSAELAVKFTLWPKQIDVLSTFAKDRLSIVLKARQLGLTWLALSYAVWRMFAQPGYAVVALSKREEDSKELVRRVKFILRYLPPWVIQEKQTGIKHPGQTWESIVLSVTINHPGKEPSVFTSMTAAPDSGRSFTASLVILDEWCFQQWAREIWTAAYPTVNRPTGGQVIGLSTAKRGTLFEEIWYKAKDKLNSFVPIFLPWNADPRRTQEWYEKTKADLGEAVHAEYPETPEEAFMFSGNSVFDMEGIINRIKALRATPIGKRGTLTSPRNTAGDPTRGKVDLREDANGYLTVYKEPEKGTPYVIGADTAEGGLDFSVAQVIDNTTGEQVATWRGHADTDLFAKELFMLGHYYNEALIAIETNFDLHPVKELERLGYHRQFKREVLDEISRKKQHKHGFKTTKGSRGPLIGDLVAIVREDVDLFNDLTTLEEMLTFVRNEDGKPEAVDGKHDDCVMSAAIAHCAREQQTMKKEVTPSQITGTYAWGQLLMMGYGELKIRAMARKGQIKLIGRAR